MDHDRLFKQLLQTFFAEFVELMLPGVDAYLDRSPPEFLDKEVFTDLTAGDRHEVDLVAKVRFKGEPAYFLVHVEFQARAESDFPKRMFRYFARLYEEHDLPVYPIVLFSYDEPHRPEPAEHRVEFLDKLVMSFRYEVIQLNRLDWRDFAQRPNPVAAALMAKMKIAPEDRPDVKLQCLRQILSLGLNAAETGMAAQFVNSYLELNTAEMVRYNEAVRRIEPPAEREAFMKVENEWTRIGEARGEVRGIAKGVSQTILRQLHRRFGTSSVAPYEAQIVGLPPDELGRLGEAVIDFATIADVEQWLDSAAQ